MQQFLLAITALAALAAFGLRQPAALPVSESEARDAPADGRPVEELRREYVEFLSRAAEEMTPEELQEAVDEIRLRLIARQLEEAAERHPDSTLEFKAQLAADVLLTDDLDVLHAVATALDWGWESKEADEPDDGGILTVKLLTPPPG